MLVWQSKTDGFLLRGTDHGGVKIQKCWYFDAKLMVLGGGRSGAFHVLNGAGTVEEWAGGLGWGNWIVLGSASQPASMQPASQHSRQRYSVVAVVCLPHRSARLQTQRPQAGRPPA